MSLSLIHLLYGYRYKFIGYSACRVSGRLEPFPLASLRRLPQYHHYLVELEAKGVTQVSCSLIGRDLNCIPVQVRKDLQYTGIIGKPKTGYAVRELTQSIESFPRLEQT